MNPATRLALIGAVSLAALCLMLPGDPLRKERSGDLTLYCAAALRVPVEQIAEAFEREHGVRSNIHYGGSNTLLSQIEVAREGDLYLAADESFLRMGQEKGLVGEIVPLGRMRAVIGVRRGNPQGIASLDDLLTRTIAAGNPDQTAIGRSLSKQLEAAGLWEPLERHIRKAGVFKPTVNDVANDILLGSVDAGILWDAVASQYPGIEAVEVPELLPEPAVLAAGVLEFANNASAAQDFVRYLSATDRGMRVFEDSGYEPFAGKRWPATPRGAVVTDP